jgi:hypothetical protein
MYKESKEDYQTRQSKNLSSKFNLEAGYRKEVLSTFLSDFFNTFEDIERSVITVCRSAGDYLDANEGPVDAVRFLEALEISYKDHAACVNVCVLPHTRTNLFNFVIHFKNHITSDYIIELFQEELNSVIVPEEFGLHDTAKLFEFFRDNSDHFTTSDYIFLFVNTLTELSNNTISFWMAIDNEYLLTNHDEA